jgi:fucose 4-O-acetylase-like acetyltransferase
MTERVPYYDRAKGLLMVLVVVGHAVAMLGHIDQWWFQDGLKQWIYLFHMPAFAAVSGYLAKPNAWTRRGVAGSVQLLVIYVIVDVIAVGIQYAFGREPTQIWLGAMWLGMWWLISLLCWRNALPVFDWIARKVGSWAAIGLALALLLAVFLWLPNGQPLSVMRTVYFGPFFLVGYLLKRRGLDLEGMARWWLPGAAVLLAAAAGVYYNSYAGIVESLPRLVYGRHTLHDLGLGTGWRTVALAGGVWLAGAVLTICFFAVVPRAGWLESVGRRSLVVYVGHLLILAPVAYAGIRPEDPLWSSLWVILMSAVLIAILTWGPLAKGMEAFFARLRPKW